MSQDHSAISPKLEEALILAQIDAQGAAGVELARRYARLLDDAAPGKAYVEALALMGRAMDHYAECEKWPPMELRRIDKARETITVALAEHSVASDLGPKLQSILAALGLVLPAAAPKQKAAPDVQPSGDTPADELARQRALRDSRPHRAASVDAAPAGSDA
jgi:hypothetical protein